MHTHTHTYFLKWGGWVSYLANSSWLSHYRENSEYSRLPFSQHRWPEHKSQSRPELYQKNQGVWKAWLIPLLRNFCDPELEEYVINKIPKLLTCWSLASSYQELPGKTQTPTPNLHHFQRTRTLQVHQRAPAPLGHGAFSVPTILSPHTFDEHLNVSKNCLTLVGNWPHLYFTAMWEK